MISLPETPTLERFLKDEQLPAGYRSQIERIHLPLAQHVLALAATKGSPLLIGIAGAQGSGKSTLARSLQLLLAANGLRAACLSLDDFYLPRAARETLAATVHPLFITRGVPGTHDVALLTSVLRALLSGEGTQIPQFDKALDDRTPEWQEIAQPMQVVLLEGWCVGARAQSRHELHAPINELECEYDRDGTWRRAVNDALHRQYAQVFALLHAFFFLAAPDFDVVLAWRLEQERKLRERVFASGSAGGHLMDEPRLRLFVQHFERLTRAMLNAAPTSADVLLELNAARKVTGMHVR